MIQQHQEHYVSPLLLEDMLIGPHIVAEVMLTTYNQAIIDCIVPDRALYLLIG